MLILYHMPPHHSVWELSHKAFLLLHLLLSPSSKARPKRGEKLTGWKVDWIYWEKSPNWHVSPWLGLGKQVPIPRGKKDEPAIALRCTWRSGSLKENRPGPTHGSSRWRRAPGSSWSLCAWAEAGPPGPLPPVLHPPHRQPGRGAQSASRRPLWLRWKEQRRPKPTKRAPVRPEGEAARSREPVMTSSPFPPGGFREQVLMVGTHVTKGIWGFRALQYLEAIFLFQFFFWGGEGQSPWILT